MDASVYRFIDWNHPVLIRGGLDASWDAVRSAWSTKSEIARCWVVTKLISEIFHIPSSSTG